MIMGHEHPSVRLRDEAGASYKFKCYLVGEVLGREVIVMPSLNELASGTDVNLASEEELLSPILRKIGIGELEPVLITEGGIEHFPKLKLLKTLL